MTTIIITRPKPVIKNTADVYQKAGFDVFLAPCFDIQTNPSVKSEWLTAYADTWLVLSVHALEHALKIAPDLRPEKNTRVIAVGPAVAKAWSNRFDHHIEFHPLMNSEGVIELLKAYQPTSIKILTTGDGRDLIRSYCMSQQISYSQINTYQRIPLSINNNELAQLYANQSSQPVILTVTSAGILEQFVSDIDSNLLNQVKKQPMVVGAKRIAEIAKNMGFTNIHTAINPGDQAMCSVVNAMM